MTRVIKYSSKSFADIEFRADVNLDPKENFKTVLIGENGTGKTRLLRDIIYALRNDEVVAKNNSKENVKMDVFFNGNYLSLGFESKRKSDSKKPICKVVAISSSINDKLPFADDGKFQDDFYKYCGLRETSNATWISSTMRKTVENLLYCLEVNKSKPLSRVFDFMGLSNLVRIRFKLKKVNQIDLFNCEPKELASYVENYSKKTSRMQVELTRDFGTEVAEEVISSFKSNVIRDTNNEAYLEVRFIDSNSNSLQTFQHIDLLRRVGLVSNISLRLAKNGYSNDFTFMDASSGESQILHSLSSFLRYVEDDSVVIIDEPEISLHPNWQVRYISLIDILLEGFFGCHIFIATHSHFLVSDLKKENSSLIAFKRSSNEVSFTPIESSTLGWSPEAILYRVFDLRITNSIYLEQDIKKAKSLMLSMSESNSEDLKIDLKKLKDKFSRLVLDAKDPLNEFISAMELCINEN